MLGSAFLALALALVPSGVTALTFSGNNQWDLACTGGKCAYYTGDGVKKAHTTFTISGPSGALSDITGAAGWQIKGCDANWSSGAAHVSIVCSGTRAQMARCSQLFEDGGAVDTIVRLPTNCGTGPFARVVSSVEITKAGNVLRGPETHAVVLDYNFNQIKKVRGEVSFAVTTSNVPSTGTVPADAAVLRRNSTELLKRWEAKQMFDLPPLAINEARNLFSQSINCPAPDGLGVGYSAGVSVDVSARVNALAAFGFTVSGTILPPAIDRFQILGSLNGSASADFTVQAHAQGSFDVGKLPLYEASIPGLNIPGILTVGPKFGVYGSLRADIGLEATIKAGVAYTFPQVDVAWPKDSGASSAKTIKSTNPLVISVDPKATATGVVTAGVIPRLEIGINVLSGFAEALAYIDLDATAVLDLTVEGHAAVTVPIGLDGSGNVVADPDVTSGASGCAGLDASLAITAGAKGTLKPIFDKEVKYPIYSTSWEIFDKCFGVGDVATKRAAMKAKRAASAAMLERRDFVCPPLGLSDLLELINQ